MTDTPKVFQTVLDSIGGWENVQLCIDAETFEVNEGCNRISIWYWSKGTRLMINIYASAESERVRVYFISPNYPCSILCDGTINKHLITAIRSLTDLSLDLL